VAGGCAPRQLQLGLAELAPASNRACARARRREREGDGEGPYPHAELRRRTDAEEKRRGGRSTVRPSKTTAATPARGGTREREAGDRVGSGAPYVGRGRGEGRPAARGRRRSGAD
jgi:hypothetical protein